MEYQKNFIIRRRKMAYRNYYIIYEDENDIKRTYFTVSKTAQEAVNELRRRNEEIRIIIVGETKNDWE
jgi:hypothetical protein